MNGKKAKWLRVRAHNVAPAGQPELAYGRPPRGRGPQRVLAPSCVRAIYQRLKRLYLGWGGGR